MVYVPEQKEAMSLQDKFTEVARQISSFIATASAAYVYEAAQAKLHHALKKLNTMLKVPGGAFHQIKLQTRRP